MEKAFRDHWNALRAGPWGGVFTWPVLSVVIAVGISLVVGPLFREAINYGGKTFMVSGEFRAGVGSGVQLYYRGEEGFREQNSFTLFLNPSTEWVSLNFPLPGRRLNELRFDPLDREGQLEIRNFRLLDPRGEVVQSFAREDLHPLREIESIEDEEGSTRVRTTSGARDPVIMLGLAEPVFESRNGWGRWGVPFLFGGFFFVLSGVILCPRLFCRRWQLRGIHYRSKGGVLLILAGSIAVTGFFHERSSRLEVVVEVSAESAGRTLVGFDRGWGYGDFFAGKLFMRGFPTERRWQLLYLPK